MTRFYHSVNTRYNIHFNANEAYKETLKNRSLNQEDNFSQMLYVFPDNSDSAAMQVPGGDFTTTIDKTTKAIKLHSIKAKPRRDPKRRNDEKYQAWLQQKEYTPFMDQVWLLLAKAEFHEANYLRAITTFMYITKIYSSNPDIVAECQLWISRAYTEMGWMYEAGNILHKMEIAGGAPESQQALYSTVKANYLIRTNEYAEAVPFLEYAIKKEKDRHQKLRLKYLLGQIYAETGDKVNANKAFASVQGMNTPYNFTFNAKLQQLQLDPSKKREDIISSLNRMAKSSKNEEYRDQIYNAIGNTYLQYQDTTKAIENYKKAIEESVRNGFDKAMAQVSLGDIYFNRREFIPAQPNYSEALPLLKKSNPDYPRVAFRSEVLDELVIHVRTVHEQDSLQYIAQLPEEERLEIINNKIEELRKEEEEKLKAEERLRLEEEREERITSWSQLESASHLDPTFNQPVQIPQQGEANQFYFYNEQSVAQGKIAFRRQWGNRKLEDDWRRRSKSGISALDDWDSANQSDSIYVEESDIGLEDMENQAVIDDIYSVDYYLQQLPFTEEAIQESNDLIENALFNMGKIYKDRLADMPLAIETFNTDISRFPDTPNLEEIYYQLLLIYMQTGDRDMLAVYRNKLLTEFPNGLYATPLSDPDFEWNFRHMPLLQDSLYNAAYNAYQQADVNTVRENYQAMKSKYPLTDMMPKFAFLNALSYAQTRDVKGLGDNLTELINKYPKADVTPMATEILERIKEGKIILSDGTPITQFDWSKAYLGDNELTDEKGKVLAYSDSLDTEYLLLLMSKSNTIDRNELLYQVADYNFSNYVIQTFDLSFDTDPPYDILQIKGFESFANIRSYMNKAFAAGGLMHKMDTSILALPISVMNYTDMLPRLGLNQYMEFFAEHFQNQLPQLIAYWNDKGTIENLAEQQPEVAEEVEEPEETLEPKTPVKPVAPEKEDLAKAEPEKPVNHKQINADDLLSREQLDKLGDVNDIIESVEDIVNNPVDGLRGLFNQYKNRNNLTKEEKAELKEQQRQEKQRKKELKAIEKARTDSINKVEKLRADSISRAEKVIEDSIKAVEKQRQQQIELEKRQKEEAAKAAIKAKGEERKQKEEDRKARIREQEERRRQLEKERKEKQKQREEERKEKERLQKERRRQLEKERDEKIKAREAERKEKEKQAEEKRKQ
ncbi:hypothetical protein [Prevotella sp. 10(H)]|uniref:type IX secretion system periplasmic lipoprotein PorW/SprE n=1 Tax=Prevotella sp. 10(H) TaxID=1158294 RepID=UPI000AB99371|nr:hypothetical protein [Prevotella sp. 10(H)]